MAGRLFHAIVLMGTGMAVACSSSSSEPIASDTGVDAAVKDSGVDTFPMIMPMMIDSATDDTNKTDTFPMIVADTGTPDTFPGIMPMPVDAG
jgi:hypothetical protein